MNYIEVSGVQSVWSDGSEDYGNGVIGPSLADVEYFKSFENQTANVITKGPLLTRRLFKPVGTALASLVAAACSSGPANVETVSPSPTIIEVSPTTSPSPEPSPTSRPTHTAVAVGGNPLPDQEMDKIAGKVARGEASEAEIDKLNAYVKAQIATALAKPTEKPVTPTPEGLKFGDYDVFSGDVDGGGKILFTTFQDGTLVFISLTTEPRCSIRDYFIYVFTTKAQYNQDGFDFRTSAGGAGTKYIKGNLIDTDTVRGSMLTKRVTGSTPKGPLVCDESSLLFTAKKAGKGKATLLEEFKKAKITESKRSGGDLGLFGSTNEEAQKYIEQYSGYKLPEN